MLRTLSIRQLVTTLAICALLSSGLMTDQAAAHEMRPAIADATVTNDNVTLRVELNLETVLSGIDASIFQDTNQAPGAAEYDRLRRLSPSELEAELRNQWPTISNLLLSEAVN